MKSIIRLLAVLASVAAVSFAAAADGPPPKTAANDGTPSWPHGDHHGDHHSDRYCCYKVKKELSGRIDSLESNVADSFEDLREDVAKNLDRVVKIEKEQKEREDLDFEQLRADVVELTFAVGEVEQEVKTLGNVGETQRHRLVEKIRLVEKRVAEEDSKIENLLADQVGEIANVTSKVDALEKGAEVGRGLLRDAAADREEIRSFAEYLADETDVFARTTNRTLEYHNERINDADGKIQRLRMDQKAEGIELDALGTRVNDTEGRVESLSDRAGSTDRGLQSLTADFENAVGNVTGMFAAQEGEIYALRDHQGALEKRIEASLNVTEGNADQIVADKVAIERLRIDVADQGAKVAANAEGIAALGTQLKRLNDGLEALRGNLEMHRADVVERLKQLTNSIAADK